MMRNYKRLDTAWPACWPMLAPALAHAGHTHDERDLLAAIASGEMQLWPGRKAAIVTELVRYPQFDAARFFLAGGDLEELRAMEPRLVDWARGQGCARVEIGGRSGWLRALTGYAPLCTVMAKPITPTERISP